MVLPGNEPGTYSSSTNIANSNVSLTGTFIVFTEIINSINDEININISYEKLDNLILKLDACRPKTNSRYIFGIIIFSINTNNEHKHSPLRRTFRSRTALDYKIRYRN